ncbi:MAG: BREX-1 system adenine-specific DNA-methyltransferase PglX [Anaerolineales bacterium]
MLTICSSERKIGDDFVSGGRNKTHNNEKYLRYVWEINSANKRWVPYANGGNFRKYSGNDLEFIDWSDAARNEYASHGGLSNEKFWGKEGITWSLITSATTGFRIKLKEQQYSSGSPTIYDKDFSCDYVLLGFLNSPVSNYYLKAITPTVNTTVNDVFSLPYLDRKYSKNLTNNVEQCTLVSRMDWDAYETAWNFTRFKLLHPNYYQPVLKDAYQNNRSYGEKLTLEMKRLEDENNRIFIEIYGLQNELSPTVPLKDITLTCNPHYRYDNNRSEEELDELLLVDTMREFISYAVGCMFGRYSLDKPGLVLANQGETIDDFRLQIEEYQERQKAESGAQILPSAFRIPHSEFLPDEDNVIPVLEGEWFNDDIAERFKKFLRVAFGEEHYEENLAFIEEAIGRDVRSYFVREFYKDHVQTYKKRPIYWMFSSPRGSFNALIYMHRYQPDTVSIVLNGYLREYIKKLNAHKAGLERTSVSGSASQSQKTKALKEIAQVNKVLSELKEYEDEVLYPLATQQVKIDLDEGVKVNYPKFGEAVSPIKGL